MDGNDKIPGSIPGVGIFLLRPIYRNLFCRSDLSQIVDDSVGFLACEVLMLQLTQFFSVIRDYRPRA